MEKRMMSGNDIIIGDEENGEGRWFDGVGPDGVDETVMPEGHF